ncbi:MAG: efflux RND transporter periplasmic adaptor subunit [Rikenellaceae bacterium]|nr:efflux RND transporter periplasmic adaptor subunit [Rikenellaceae bacterium]
MKISKLALFAAAAMLVACGSRNQTANHHEHDAHDHSAHAHTEHAEHNHAEHAEEAHHHDHEGHSHEAEHAEEGHSHAHKAGKAHEVADGEIHFSHEQAEAAGVETEILVVSPFAEVIATSGVVESAQGSRTTIVAPAAGVVKFKNVYAGSRVRAGQTIATISGRNIAEGDPAEQVRIDYELARKELQRAEKLVAEKIVSQQEYDRIKSTYELARQRYDALLSEGESGVVVKAPSDGYIVEVSVANGDYVSTGQTLYTITAGNRMTLVADLPVGKYDRLQSISSANFAVPYGSKVYSTKELGGRIEAVGRCAEGAAYLPITFAFVAPQEVLSGSFAEVWLECAPRENVLSVPREALSEEQGLYFVYLKLDDECYRKQEVTLGVSNGRRVEIIGHELEGCEVVVKGTTQVKLAATSSIIPEGHSHNH